MKRLVQLTLALFLFWIPMTAQETVTYDFEDGLMPEGFTLINADMLIPFDEGDAAFIDSAWIVIESGLLNSFAALSLSWYVDDAGPADDWMILPKFTLGDGAKLSWTAQSTTSSGNYPDSYQVLLNTGEPTDVDFAENGEILLTIAPEAYETAQMREIDLSAYAGQSVHLAFRNITPSGDALLVDDISISNVIMTNTAEVDNAYFQLKVLSNPVSQNIAQLSYTLKEASDVTLLVQDLMGRTQLMLPLGEQFAGTNRADIDTSNLPAGTYVASIRTEDKIGTTKMVLTRSRQ
ncbi:MAG: choice-of-anchor J domain-containing protein [Phaeodactylibacter sp.]|nr:choice-of-anchor J domain-containing protein [Phaeodactylibacter sp.]MCB9301427.1 choice-of-anchor J domain-containing protein [Lewinellaceae bacterium]HQU58137.1 choice-of-anchor J domain-containing protein [Saprospiraceae bacterium]